METISFERTNLEMLPIWAGKKSDALYFPLGKYCEW